MIIGVPYSGCDFKDAIYFPRENSALGYAIWARLAWKDVTVFMQNSWLWHIWDLFSSFLIPSKLKWIKFIINNRKEPEHHKHSFENINNLLKIYGIENAELN